MLISDKEPPWWRDPDKRALAAMTINALVSLIVGGVVVILVSRGNSRAQEEIVRLQRDLDKTELEYEPRLLLSESESDRITTTITVRNTGREPARDVRFKANGLGFKIDTSLSRLDLEPLGASQISGDNASVEVTSIHPNEVVTWYLVLMVEDGSATQLLGPPGEFSFTCDNCLGSAERIGALSPPPGTRVHIVRFGETLYSIGRLYDVAPATIAEANGIVNPSLMFAGQQLLIPIEVTSHGTAQP